MDILLTATLVELADLKSVFKSCGLTEARKSHLDRLALAVRMDLQQMKIASRIKGLVVLLSRLFTNVCSVTISWLPPT